MEITYDGSLAPCPKCGGNVALVVDGPAGPSVWCPECETVYMPQDVGALVRLWWNTRTEGHDEAQLDRERQCPRAGF